MADALQSMESSGLPGNYRKTAVTNLYIGSSRMIDNLVAPNVAPQSIADIGTLSRMIFLWCLVRT